MSKPEAIVVWNKYLRWPEEEILGGAKLKKELILYWMAGYKYRIIVLYIIKL